MAALDHGNIVRLYGKYHDIDLVFCIGMCVCVLRKSYSYSHSRGTHGVSVLP